MSNQSGKTFEELFTEELKKKVSETFGTDTNSYIPTKTEIEKLVDIAIEYQNDSYDALHYLYGAIVPASPMTPEQLDSRFIPKTCSHEWLEYQGLKEFYKYCKKCDQKFK